MKAKPLAMFLNTAQFLGMALKYTNMHQLIKTAKDRRKELCLSQRHVAKILGVRQASISSMETGKTDSRLLALDIIEALGGVLRVEFNDEKEEV